MHIAQIVANGRLQSRMDGRFRAGHAGVAHGMALPGHAARSTPIHADLRGAYFT